MNEEMKLIRCRIRMTETGNERVAYVVVDDWQRLDDWAGESRCEVLDANVLASTAWNDSTLSGMVGA
jgi:hypothetical protein